MRVVWVLFIIMAQLHTWAQPGKYYMSNAKISVCDGILYDSEEGLRTGEYDHNENYIFTICVPGASNITLVFDSFCTERDEDYLILYEGRDTNARRIGNKHHGSTSPGTVSSSDSCITLYFHSDKSVSCFGFKATWSTVVAPLPQPRFVRPPSVSCEDDVIGVRLDQKFNCDSVPDSAFRISGPVNATVVSVTPVNCDANNQTDTFNIRLSPMLDASGLYRLQFQAVKWDVCDSPWILRAQTFFNINDCPIEVELFAIDDTICRGSCTEIWAVVEGGDSNKYMFNWNKGIQGRYGPHRVCPDSSTDYILTVSDGAAVPDTDTLTIVVIDPPKVWPDTTVCLSSPSFALRTDRSGGTWSGRGIGNPRNNWYDPGRAGPGRDTVIYHFGACSDTLIVNVRNIDAGRPNASCPFASPFQVFDFTPAGGTWSGPNIDSTGLFTPGDTGTFQVTYTWSGCTDTKIVFVYPLAVPLVDTVCLSTANVELRATPPGGRWSGPGISDPLSSLFYPPLARAGTHRLIYTSNGCRDTTMVHVVDINARGNQVACPDAAPFNVLQGLPAGGYWTGRGITDSVLGTYDASFVFGINRTSYNDTLRYYLNGCVASKVMFVRRTVVVVDTLRHCIGDQRTLLDYVSTGRSPGGGIWSGPGVIGNYYYPNLSGHGIHKLRYLANGCTDSMYMRVYPAVQIQQDTSFCISDPPYTLWNPQRSGYFKGPGILDTAMGLFEPKRAGNGIHKLYYYSQFGCLDSLSIEVYGLPVVRLTSYDPYYCFRDTLHTLGVNPSGGWWRGRGLIAGRFNPGLAGSGNHMIYYSYGRPTCYSTDSAVLRVLDTLKVRVRLSADTICPGEVILGDALPGGGTGNYSMRWQNGASGASLISYPDSGTWVWCEVRDGCSDLYRDSIRVHVHPKVSARVLGSPVQCYGLNGFAEVIPSDNDTYGVQWHLVPPRTGMRLNAPVANRYPFTLTNLRTGCQFDSMATIAGYNRIRAYFVTSPGTSRCLNPFNPQLHFIHQSYGATGGYWIFGDGDSAVFDPLQNPIHVFKTDTSQYTITLVIWNEGGCSDTASVTICIDDSVYVLIPTAFSPNGDGINDEFHILTAGVTELEFILFNRWGEHLYRSSDLDFSWDGTYLGNAVQKGTYSYQVKYKGRKNVWKIATGVLVIL